MNLPPQPNGGLGFPGDGNDLAPGATFRSLESHFLGGLKEEYEDYKQQQGDSSDSDDLSDDDLDDFLSSMGISRE